MGDAGKRSRGAISSGPVLAAPDTRSRRLEIYMANQNWMRSIADDTNITRMAIPGTHDSGAWQYCYTPMCRAHDLDIAAQLNIGVRAFDIRVGDKGGGIYKVYHGPIDMDITVQSVLDDIVAFLNTNPSEFVILMLKQETGNVDISGQINALVNTALAAKLYPYNAGIEQWPELSAVRKRVLVFSRLGRPHASHFNTTDWPKNPTNAFLKLNPEHGNLGIMLQDLYDKPQVIDKQQAIQHLLDCAQKSENETLLYVNYTSFVWTLYEPLSIGKNPTKPWLLKQRGKGVICVDAVDADITEHIIGNNVRMNAPAVVPVPRLAYPGQSLQDAFADFRRRVYEDD
jgi:1-phosphatidylinositol phosphodiesterase